VCRFPSEPVPQCRLARRFVGSIEPSAWLASDQGAVEDLKELTSSFRNPAAHIETMRRRDYVGCRVWLSAHRVFSSGWRGLFPRGTYGRDVG
jgi:hypothetical protein